MCSPHQISLSDHPTWKELLPWSLPSLYPILLFNSTYYYLTCYIFAFFSLFTSPTRNVSTIKAVQFVLHISNTQTTAWSLGDTCTFLNWLNKQIHNFWRIREIVEVRLCQRLQKWGVGGGEMWVFLRNTLLFYFPT